MTRFITVHVGCDWPACETVAPEGEGIVIEKTVSIDGKQGRSFLLCKKHVDDFETVVLPLMQAGVKVEGCDRHGRPLTNRTGMAQHAIRSHGYADLAAYEAEFGPVATVPRKNTKNTSPSVEGTVAPVDEPSIS